MASFKRLRFSIKIFLLITITSFVLLITFFINWKSQGINKSGSFCLHPKNIAYNSNINPNIKHTECFTKKQHTDKINHKKNNTQNNKNKTKCNLKNPTEINIQLKSESGVIFDIKYIKNASKSCINPDFPIILIDTETPHNGWIQIVYTDSIDTKLRKFIDYDPNFLGAPLYNNSQYFYDAPLWTYSLFKKPLTFWRARTFAVTINKKNKIINCIGGIEWGFELHKMRFKPVAIEPRLLNKKDWEDAFEVLKDKFPEYKNT